MSDGELTSVHVATVLEDFYLTPSLVEDTLPISEGEEVFVIDRNPANPEWWQVAVRWEEGYVPASFLAVRGEPQPEQQLELEPEPQQPEPEPEPEPELEPRSSTRTRRARWTCCGAPDDSLAVDGARVSQLQATVATQARALQQMDAKMRRQEQLVSAARESLRSLARDLVAVAHPAAAQTGLQPETPAAEVAVDAGQQLLDELSLSPSQQLLLQHSCVDGRAGATLSEWPKGLVLRLLTEVRYPLAVALHSLAPQTRLWYRRKLPALNVFLSRFLSDVLFIDIQTPPNYRDKLCSAIGTASSCVYRQLAL